MLVLAVMQAEIFSLVLHAGNIPNTQSLRAIAHHSTYSALGASTFHSLRTRFAHQLIAGAKQYWAYPNYYPGLQTDT